MIRFETTLGDFTIELFDKEAPLSVANFLRYIDDEFFDDLSPAEFDLLRFLLMGWLDAETLLLHINDGMLRSLPPDHPALASIEAKPMKTLLRGRVLTFHADPAVTENNHRDIEDGALAIRLPNELFASRSHVMASKAKRSNSRRKSAALGCFASLATTEPA